MDTTKMDAILARLHELEEENIKLRDLLSKHGIPYEAKKQVPVSVESKFGNNDSAMKRLSLQEKVELFRTLFKGRDNRQVYSLVR